MTSSLRNLVKDEGFSLAELVMVMALLSLVLAAAWGGMLVINRAATVNASSASAAANASEPVEQISQCLMQNTMMAATDMNGLNPTGPNSITVWTNPSMGSNPEMDTFTTVKGTDGKYQLQWKKWVTTSDMKTVVKTTTWPMSYENVNKLVNVPLFTYLDASGTVVPSAQDIPSSTRSVIVRVVASLPNSRTIEASRTIYFRNRN